LIRGKFHIFIVYLFSLEAVVVFIISKLLRRRIIIKDTHWYWPDTLPAKLFWPIAKFMVKHANLFFCSKIVMQYYRSAGISPRVKEAPVYTSVINYNREDVLRAKKLKEKIGHKKLVLYFGRLVRYKGASYLIRAFAKLLKEDSDVFLIIAGEGPEKERLKKMCNDLKLKNIWFTGYVKPEDKPMLFLACDIFVHPATYEKPEKTPEEWGLVVNEAMSVGKPVIVTTAVGAKEMVKRGVNGFIVPPGDVDALYRAIKVLLENDELRTKMGKMSKEIIKSYTPEVTMKKYDEAITYLQP